MKKITLIIFVFLPVLMFSQSIKTGKIIDTASVVFKAKMFTISKHDFRDMEAEINSINKTPYEIYGSNEFLFIKIKAKFYCQEKGNFATFTWCECDYYICYSINRNFFYLLGGFETNNIKEFAQEYKGSLFSINWTYKIKDEKLNMFLEKVSAGKLKTATKIFNKCIESY